MGQHESNHQKTTLGDALTAQVSAAESYNAHNVVPTLASEETLQTTDDDNNNNSNPTTLRITRTASKQIISFSLTDPEHPTNWPRRRKWQVFFAGIATVLNSTLSSSLPSNAIGPISSHFNVTSEIQMVLPISCFLMGYVIGPILCGPLSEHFGRKRVILGTFVLFIIFNMACAVAPTWASFLVFRLFCGIVASGPIAIVPGLYADIYNDPRERGMAMAYFMSATTCGPLLAPPISGFIGETVNWRWVFGFGTFFALATLPALMFMPESYLPVLLSRKAARLRMETGNEKIVAVTDLQKKSLGYVLKVVMTRPYRMLVQESIVACVCVYASLTYAIFYLYFEAYPIVFLGPTSVYNFSPGLAGLTFIPIGIGAIMTSPIFMYWDSFLAKARKERRPWAAKEEYRRLPLACVGGPLYVIAIFWLGWSARTDVHWIVPTLSGIPFGIGYLLIFMALLNYVSDAYLTFAASAQGIASTCRSVGGSVLPLASKRMFTDLGIGWACSVLGFLMLLCSAIPFVFIVYGERIRAGSKFCQELKKIADAEERDREKRRRRENGGEAEEGPEQEREKDEDEEPVSPVLER